MAQPPEISLSCDTSHPGLRPQDPGRSGHKDLTPHAPAPNSFTQEGD